MKSRRILGLFGFTLVSAFVAVFLYAKFFQSEQQIVEVPVQPVARQIGLPALENRFTMDFTAAAESSVNAVVHVKTTAFRQMEVNPLYEFFFGITPESQSRPVMGFGSGVIISEDGYIVTNNHVIEGSDEVQVTMNDRREFKAELIGVDPTTDLALLKIDEKGLPTIKYGDSDNLQMGEWVLAVGNPYNLTSTVTAGIVSAKARNINILRNSFSIESFIQTDAAVNPGNSGGALVNTLGQLVGINTAIASRTGNYTGYSFAIPVSIVQKVVGDLMEFGEVQRAILGVTITNVTSELAKEEGLDDTRGVYVTDLSENGAAKDAGIKPGDVITSINGIRVNTVSELQEQVSKYRPKDKVKVVLKRNGNMKQFDVVLRNMQGSTDIVRTNEIIEVLGARFEPLNTNDKQKLGIANGVRVTDLKPGKFMKVGIKKGFVVTSVNKKPVDSVKDISDILRGVDGGVIIEGVYNDGSKSYYAFGM
ncbi:MAG: Do family serine endopeptidase [Bacteroidales bacterium]|nr:Do family serine endopeptidase [Bacteroidales bacterium]MDT8432488.1 Do family serine endopeptidase [Bacteroidales bacterium]